MLLLLPALTGFLLVASFPRFNQAYLAWIAFIPLIAFVVRVRKPVRAFLGGYVAGGIELFALLVWMPAVLQRYGGLSVWLAWTGYVLLILLLACFLGAGCYATKKLMLRGGDACLLLFPAVWIVIEYAQTKIPFGGFPWLLVGYSQSDWLSLIQIADLTGVYGISFLVTGFSTAVVWAVMHKGRNFRAWWPVLGIILLVFACFLYGRASLDRWDGFQEDSSAAMLQGNLSADETGPVLAEKYQDGYLRMADDLQFSSVDLLILPESPTPVMYEQNAPYREMLKDLAVRYTYGLIFNNIRREETGEGLKYFNSAYYLNGKGALSGAYDKIHLVPFGEYIPLKRLFVFMRTISQDVGGFHPGRENKIFKLGQHPANAIVCFEAIFPGLVRGFVRNGSRLIVNLTNDRWYGDSSAPFQHFSIARWRAVENRRYLLRAANSGISAVIEPTGRIQTATGILQQAVCEGRFAFIAQQTFYTRYGDMFVFLCAIIVCSFTILVLTRERKKRPLNNKQ
ncbi:MAG: apolipoprotein N-acyltransferase [Acidobacteria bacterium]|nr:apolipoprotein N-acyltransferase [Acidobacteriota bacterium]